MTALNQDPLKLTIISTNKYDAEFIQSLRIEKVVWCLNPLIKYYDEAKKTLEAMKVYSERPEEKRIFWDIYDIFKIIKILGICLYLLIRLWTPQWLSCTGSLHCSTCNRQSDQSSLFSSLTPPFRAIPLLSLLHPLILC